MTSTNCNKFAFSLIELLVVIVILGIITTAVLPSISLHMLRSKVSSMYDAAAAAKFVISNDYLNQGTFTTSNYGNGNTPFTTSQSTVISTINIANGIITITGVASKLNSNAINLKITPSVSPTNAQQINWACCVSSTTFLDFVPEQCKTAC